MSAPHSNDVPKNRLPVTFADVDYANSADSIAQRDSEGGIRVRYPTQSVHAATKGYVDAGVSTRAPTSHSHPVGDLTATGTASSSTYLRGDGTWATPTNTTYSVMSEAEATAGTATTARTLSAARLKGAITTHTANKVDTSDPRLSDARTPTAHTHAIAQVTGLQSELDGKAASSHTHTPGSLGAVAASGAAATLWAGSQAEYDALPEATRNAVGFVAVIV